VRRNQKCPICQNKIVVKGINDFQSNFPNLMNDWNFKKNKDIQPDSLSLNSHIKVWWLCHKCNHEWQTTINSRNSGNGCPYCSGRYVIKGKNDLITLNPKLAKEWNYEKNGDLRPEDFMPNSNKKVWWKCSKGHEWQAIIASRNKGNGCPYCSGRKK
jgi:DNA-directed RNA polymerase subunit RPC12/RpoP